MKVVLCFVALILVLPGSLGNPVTDAHDYIHTLFLNQKNYFDGIRIYVGTYTELTASSMIDIVTSEIATWQSRGRSCKGNIFRPRNTEEFGEDLSICVMFATSHLETVGSLIYFYLEAEQEITNGIQMTIMRELRTVNLLEDYDTFYAYARELGAQIEARFYNQRYPDLIEHLEFLDWTAENLPTMLENCINDIPRRLTKLC
ncbi:hypothetical protein DMENIID0001_055320 [Sergentomyia squamirostris]